MAYFNYFDTAGNILLEEVLVGAVAQDSSDANIFELVNPVNGFKIIFFGSDFTYSAPAPTGVPMGGSISTITLVNGSGDVVLEVGDFASETASLATFWAAFAASAYSYSGAAAAFTNLLDIQKDDQILGTIGDDRIGVYDAGGILLGHAGNDTFVVNAGVTGAEIYGTVLDGSGADAQSDIVEIRGNASNIQFHNIDVLRFGDNPGDKTLTFNGFAQLDVKVVQGSQAGADSLKFVGASEAANIDISHLQFTNWGRENQQILVSLNTDTTRVLDDRFVGSMAAERVTAGNGRDLLYGNAGDDYLDGGEGVDVLDGGDGNDTLIGGADRGRDGPNVLKGGKGNDVYKSNEKVDIVIDAGGLDSRMVSKNSTLSTKDKFEGLAADDTLSKAINLTGNAKTNILIGHAGKNTLKGMNGNDILEGRLGADQLDGGAGNDKLYGGLGNDKLTGGAGRDTFYFDSLLSSANVDKIIGFSTKDDLIALDREIFSTLSGSKLASSSFYIGSKAKDAGDQIIYNKSTGALYYDADGTGTAAAAIKFATLDKNLKLTASDFIII